MEIMISVEGDKIIKKQFNSLKNRYQNNLEVMSWSSIMFSYCIINVMKQLSIMVDHIQILLTGYKKTAIINPINKKDNNKKTEKTEKKHIVFTFQNINQIVKNKLFFNDSKQRRMVLPCSQKSISILKGIKS